MDEIAATQLETALTLLPEISAARIVIDPTGTLSEIHVVGNGKKSDKQLARDVQTVAHATFGMEFDHRIISIVQYSQNGNGNHQKRASIVEISTDTRGINTTVRVVLAKSGRTEEGEAQGASTVDSLHRLSAQATLQAISKLLGEGIYLALEHVAVQRAGDQEIVLATVRFAGKEGTVDLAGSAVVTSQHVDAVARAVLDAVNRRAWRD